MTRRGLLRNIMWASAGAFALQATVTGLAMFWPRKVEGFGSVIDAGPIEDFPVGTVTRVRDGRFYISRLPEGVLALYWRCPHLGCTVPWVEGERLVHLSVPRLRVRADGTKYRRTGAAADGRHAGGSAQRPAFGQHGRHSGAGPPSPEDVTPV